LKKLLVVKMSQLKMIVLLERCHRVEEVRVGWGDGSCYLGQERVDVKNVGVINP
jgi:hypothetical protein